MKFDKKKFLKQNENFCMAPWVHMSIWQDGSVRPCCISKWDIPYGQFDENNDTIAKVFNSDQYRELRLKMINNEKIESCRSCYLNDTHDGPSYRKYFNKKYKNHFNLVEDTNPDGSVNDTKLKFLDIKFSNNCNFRCRMCNPWFSSSIAQSMIKNGLYTEKALVSAFTFENLREELTEIAKGVEEVYFAGGEPFITEENYYFLEMLVEQKTNPYIRINTNLSTLNYKNWNVIDILKNFSNIQIGASIDHVENRLEFIRKGANWNKIKKNIEKIRKELPYIDLRAAPTITIYNIVDIDYWFPILEDLCGLVSLANISFTPVELSIVSLPKELKEKADLALSKIDNGINNISVIRNYMWSRDCYDSFKFKTLETLNRFDLLNQSNWRITYPEFVQYYDIQN